MQKVQQEQRLRENVVPFRARDGLQCNLVHVQGETEPHKGPVLLVHGAGVRANIFRAPVETNLVDYLSPMATTSGWRTGAPVSTCPPIPGPSTRPRSMTTPRRSRRWSKRQAGTRSRPDPLPGLHQLYDVGGRRAGAAGHHHREQRRLAAYHRAGFSGFKIERILPFVTPFTQYLNPQWGLHAHGFTARAIDLLWR